MTRKRRIDETGAAEFVEHHWQFGQLAKSCKPITGTQADHDEIYTSARNARDAFTQGDLVGMLSEFMRLGAAWERSGLSQLANFGERRRASDKQQGDSRRATTARSNADILAKWDEIKRDNPDMKPTHIDREVAELLDISARTVGNARRARSR